MNKLKFPEGTSAWDLNSNTTQYKKFVRNPSKKELEKWGYLPRLTGYRKKGFDNGINIRIEFSVPKLVFLNNLDEVQQIDFPAVVYALQERLSGMGVLASRELLENASVSSVHFSKNIELEDGFTATYVISEINRVNIPKSFDLAQTRYINGGESLYAHTTTHQFVAYDKIADLKKDRKRAIDKEQPQYQRGLFSNFQDKSTEVLRFEIRLGNKQKMNKLFEQFGYQKNMTFKDVFSTELSKKIITSYWEKIIKERSVGLFALPFNTRDALRALLFGEKGVKPKQAVYLVGLLTLAKDEGGMRTLRSILSKKSGQRTWYRFVRDLEATNEKIGRNKTRDWVTQIDQQLVEFRAYRNKKAEDSLSTG